LGGGGVGGGVVGGGGGGGGGGGVDADAGLLPVDSGHHWCGKKTWVTANGWGKVKSARLLRRCIKI